MRTNKDVVVAVSLLRTVFLYGPTFWAGMQIGPTIICVFLTSREEESGNLKYHDKGTVTRHTCHPNPILFGLINNRSTNNYDFIYIVYLFNYVIMYS